MKKLLAWSCFAFALCLVGGSSPQVGAVLVYEIDRDGVEEGAKVDMQGVVRSVERRVNPAGKHYGKVELQPDGKIRVDVDGQEAADLDRIKMVLCCTGLLEFRILANTHDNAGLIEKARASNAHVVRELQDDGTSKVTARWLRAAKAEADGMRQNPLVISRDDGAGGLEVLVVWDDIHLTGKYLKSVNAGFDQVGRPCIQFEFDRVGAPKMGMITMANLPDAVQDFKRQLGIILDRTIITAPSINSAIFDKGEITGNFTAADTERLADILMAGPFPAPIKLVSETKPAP